MEDNPISNATMLFVGVSTGGSAALSLFPTWTTKLGLAASLVGVDLPLDASPNEYRAVVDRVAGDRHVSGALVTSHKVAMYEACGHEIKTWMPAARRLKEVGVLFRDSDGAIGADANDFFSTREVSSALLSERERFAADGIALILGAGGAGTALAHTLSADPSLGCRQIRVLDIDEERVAVLRDKVIGWDNPVPVQVEACGRVSDALVSSLPEGSLIVNATGLGKDRPGSPVTPSVILPLHSVVWDFNYRFVMQGEPNFFQIANDQASDRHLEVEDGWRYFLWGWAFAVSRIFEIPDANTVFAAIAATSPRGDES
ncbi:shikimate dehydrogenase [Actinoallomurus bryophytorum]|uniref:Shikimate 5-dehydrogenase n=1 Tax=Actinoallomurus bryophytorum TaxID=1490222 RepID=A0A543CIU3_9ACTN|nr:shikimate dehydrogenase [Actinoallomurus bryophytorum]TQL97011.1 shikimate 5-dehydrogenase [Actinoallomurus bryophytorum]